MTVVKIAIAIAEEIQKQDSRLSHTLGPEVEMYDEDDNLVFDCMPMARAAFIANHTSGGARGKGSGLNKNLTKEKTK